MVSQVRANRLAELSLLQGGGNPGEGVGQALGFDPADIAAFAGPRALGLGARQRGEVRSFHDLPAQLADARQHRLGLLGGGAVVDPQHEMAEMHLELVPVQVRVGVVVTLCVLDRDVNPFPDVTLDQLVLLNAGADLFAVLVHGLAVLLQQGVELRGGQVIPFPDRLDVLVDVGVAHADAGVLDLGPDELVGNEFLQPLLGHAPRRQVIELDVLLQLGPGEFSEIRERIGDTVDNHDDLLDETSG